MLISGIDYNCEGAQILPPYLQAHKVTCHSFMDAGRRYETPASEMKGYKVSACAKQLALTG